MPRASTEKLTDESPMPFGKYKGLKLIDVPAFVLIFLYDNDLKEGPLRDYIEDNLQALKKEK